MLMGVPMKKISGFEYFTSISEVNQRFYPKRKAGKFPVIWIAFTHKEKHILFFYIMFLYHILRSLNTFHKN